MPIVALRTVGFRNLADDEIRTDAGSVFLVGENGQGKTNFLEAIYFCSYASSFREGKEADFLKNGEKSCSVTASVSGESYDSISVRIEEGKKTALIDGKRVEDRKQLLCALSPIVFCHDDMHFVSGEPERRRWFFDQSLSLHDEEYVEELRKYRKILKTRNALLKERRASMLEFLDVQYIESGLRIMEKRRTAAEFFSSSFLPLFRAVSGIDGVSVRYSASWKTEDPDALLSMLEGKRDAELEIGTSLSGPHRDRYAYVRGESDFAAKASTGQRRLLALLLRVTQARRYAAVKRRRPLLLLDDVLLELDPEKRLRFLSVLPDYEQAFFTFMPGEPHERYARQDTVVYRVSDGRLEK